MAAASLLAHSRGGGGGGGGRGVDSTSRPPTAAAAMSSTHVISSRQQPSTMMLRESYVSGWRSCFSSAYPTTTTTTTFMRRANNSSSSSCANHYCCSNSTYCRWMILLCIGMVAIVAIQQQKMNFSMVRRQQHLYNTQQTSKAAANAATRLKRCIENDEIRMNAAEEHVDEKMSKDQKYARVSTSIQCRCADPLIGTAKQIPAWRNKHEQMKATARAAANDGVEVVILGDSIVERLSGTHNYGKVALPEEAAIYQQWKNQSSVVALGCSGDTTNHLLYHIQHGLLLPDDDEYLKPSILSSILSSPTSSSSSLSPPQLRLLQPKVFVILIGTNNISRNRGCNRRNTLAGILQVAKVIQLLRPEAHIVLHGLLPRLDELNDDDDDTDSSSDSSDSSDSDSDSASSDASPGSKIVERRPLLRYWDTIVWINQQLEQFCSLYDTWHYFDANALFLERDRSSSSSAMRLKTSLMPDGLHPNAKGYILWTTQLKIRLKTILEEED